VDRLIARVRDALPLDGIYLALHGSMQVEELDGAPEAHILRRVRSVVGERAKIAVSYDLHANFSEGLLADVVVAYRTNPHWDLAPTGYRAGARLIRALRGEITPVHAWRKLPMVLGGGTTIDFVAPMRQVFRFMKRLEARPGIVSASLFMVHPYTNAETLGWAVHVCADGDQRLADASADELADEAWQRRLVPMPDMYSVDAAIRAAADDPRRRLGPVTFVDVDDIVGAGAPGGNTRIVRALREEANELTAFVPVHDPRLIEELWSTSVERGTFTLRGTPGYGAPEVELDATIACRTETEYGRVLRLDAGRIQVIVTERPPLPIHPRFWRQVGLRARDADIIVQKNFFHYRVFHVAHTFSHYPVSSEARGEGGATSFSHVRAYARAHGLFPATDLSEWRTFDRAVRSHDEAAYA
jgi:microcystin degradation protein MlrC